MIFMARHRQRNGQSRAAGRTGKLDQVRLQGPGQRKVDELISKGIQGNQSWENDTDKNGRGRGKKPLKRILDGVAKDFFTSQDVRQ